MFWRIFVCCKNTVNCSFVSSKEPNMLFSIHGFWSEIRWSRCGRPLPLQRGRIYLYELFTCLLKIAALLVIQKDVSQDQQKIPRHPKLFNTCYRQQCSCCFLLFCSGRTVLWDNQPFEVEHVCDSLRYFWVNFITTSTENDEKNNVFSGNSGISKWAVINTPVGWVISGMKSYPAI